MKVDISKKSPYVAVIDLIREMTKENGYECVFDRIVKIKTTVLGVSNELLLVDGEKMDYYWQNDWYEGGEVELLGFINVDDVEVPNLNITHLMRGHIMYELDH